MRARNLFLHYSRYVYAYQFWRTFSIYFFNSNSLRISLLNFLIQLPHSLPLFNFLIYLLVQLSYLFPYSLSLFNFLIQLPYSASLFNLLIWFPDLFPYSTSLFNFIILLPYAISLLHSNVWARHTCTLFISSFVFVKTRRWLALESDRLLSFYYPDKRRATI